MLRIFNSQITISPCSFCNGSRYQTDQNDEPIYGPDSRPKKCSCYYENAYLDANIGTSYWNLNPSTYEGSELDLANVMQFFGSNVHNLKQTGQGLYIFGRNGVGKTSLGIMLLKHIIETTSYSAMFVPFSDLVILNSRLISGFYDKEAGVAVELIKNKDFLMLDDIGKEYDDGKDKARATLNSILRYRDMWKKPTIYTANNDIAALRTHYGEGNYTIIYGRSIVIEMENQTDFRKRKKQSLTRISMGEI